MKNFYLIIILLLLLTGLAFWQLDSARLRPPSLPLNYNQPIQSIFDQQSTDTSTIFIFIQKDSLLLTVLEEDSTPIKSYPVALGGNPKDDKLMQGDQCTPEGTFFIRAAYPHEKWDFFVWINYPTDDSWKKHNKAKAEGRIPADASVGGEIGIHGVPLGADYLIDQKVHWTLGCISLKSEDIRELYPYLKAGRKVVIR